MGNSMKIEISFVEISLFFIMTLGLFFSPNVISWVSPQFDNLSEYDIYFKALSAATLTIGGGVFFSNCRFVLNPKNGYFFKTIDDGK